MSTNIVDLESREATGTMRSDTVATSAAAAAQLKWAPTVINCRALTNAAGWHAVKKWPYSPHGANSIPAVAEAGHNASMNTSRRACVVVT